jgi:uncharacterized membrane protein YhaH (DUF805 family)
MGFTEAVTVCFSKYADFQGRARRSEYWFFALFNLLAVIGVVIVGAIIGYVIGSASSSRPGETVVVVMLVLLGLYWLGMLLPTLAVAVRRFHDLGVTGWFVVIFAVGGLIPFVGFLASIGQLIWFCMRGTVGSNNYGPDPYGPDPIAVFS